MIAILVTQQNWEKKKKSAQKMIERNKWYLIEELDETFKNFIKNYKFFCDGVTFSD